MWKRDAVLRPVGGAEGAGGQGRQGATGGTAAQQPGGDVKRPLALDVVNIGKSVLIKGEVTGSEDLTINAQVEGKIELRQHALTIGPNGKINAPVFAKLATVLGEVRGNITASEKVNICENGSVDGDLVAPKVTIAEGAHFRGLIEMQRAPGAPGAAEAKAGSTSEHGSTPSAQVAAPR